MDTGIALHIITAYMELWVGWIGLLLPLRLIYKYVLS